MIIKTKKIMLIFGTRPEAIKMCPLALELNRRKGIETVVCVTGQHKEMLRDVLDIFDISPRYDLAIMKAGQDLFDIAIHILEGIREVLQKEKPDIVLVHGDTSTTFLAGLSCYYLKIPVGHVEAGLRTHNIYAPYPEEFNRQAVGILAQYHFAPTKAAAKNLLGEGKKTETIYITGNTVIDALQTTVKEDYTHPVLEWAKDAKLILLTAHRRENWGEPLEHIFKAIVRLVADNQNIKVVYPLHLNPQIRECAARFFEKQERIQMIEPLGVLDFHNLMKRSYMILTDSGGIQEEAPALGIPVLVMRDTTERYEGVEAGTLRLVGTVEDTIYQEAKELLHNPEAYQRMSKAANPYGDGKASVRIADILCESD